MANLQLRVLTSEEVSTICDKCMDFLSTKGVKVDHQQALKLLNKAGAQVDFDSGQVRFSKDIIEEALRVVPRNVTLAGQSEHRDLRVPHPSGLFYTLINTGARNYLDPETNIYRDVTLAEIAEWAQLTEALDEIDCCSILTARDVPEETLDIHSLKTVFENTSKHVNVQPFSFNSVEYLFELAMTVAGSTEAFKKRPVISILTAPITPFAFSDMFVEVIIQGARHKAPISADSLPSIGATSPITIAGTVLLACTEVLAITVMSQLFGAGTPILARPLVWGMDMATGRNIHCNVETILTDMAGVQIFKEGFQIPAQNYAFGNDSYIPDGEAAIESAQRGLLLTLAGADIVGAAGRMNAMSGVSPVQLMIDKSLVNTFKRAISGVKVDDETLAWSEIVDTVPGTGHFLDRAHTLRHCREAVLNELFVNKPYDDWKAGGGKDLYTRALDKYRELKKKLQPQQLPGDVQKELNRIVKQADERLVK